MMARWQNVTPSGQVFEYATRALARAAKRANPALKSMEYPERITRGLRRNLSTAQARGHARPSVGERSVSVLREAGIIPERTESTDTKIYARALPALQRGESVKQAAKEAGVSESSLRRFGDRHGIFEAESHRTLKSGKSVPARLRFHAPAAFHVIEKDGDVHFDVEMTRPNASLMGKYWNAVRDVLNGDDDAIHAFKGRSVQGIDGQRHALETDPEAIRAYFESLTPSEHAEFNRTLYKRRTPLARAA